MFVAVITAIQKFKKIEASSHIGLYHLQIFVCFFSFFVSDGKILVHSRRSDMSIELSGHNQEVNCLDSKDGLIVSGSRDQTARVRTLLQSSFINVMHSAMVLNVTFVSQRIRLKNVNIIVTFHFDVSAVYVMYIIFL